MALIRRVLAVKGGTSRGGSGTIVLLLTAGEGGASVSGLKGAGIVCVDGVGSAIEGQTADEPLGDEPSSGSIVVVRLSNNKARDGIGNKNLVL